MCYQAIQSGLTILIQLQDALWRDLPVLKDPILQTLDRINVDRNLLDQEVRAEMRIGAARLMADRWIRAHNPPSQFPVRFGLHLSMQASGARAHVCVCVCVSRVSLKN